MLSATLVSLASLAIGIRAGPAYTTTFSVGSLPDTWQEGQTGTDNCGTGYSNTSMCQVAYMNSIEDFCVWGPPNGGPIGETERIEVSYCMKAGYGTRLIPDGTIVGAHWVQTPDYVQITGNGDFSKIGIPKGDAGGELDPHGADGNGNPIGGLVFGNSFGKMQQYHEWTSFMSITEFCFRACKDGPNAAQLCNHIYDVMGCQWNMPADYTDGAFDSCLGDSAEPMGIYGGSTWYQGQAPTPAAHNRPATSSCTTTASLTQILAVTTTAPATSPAATNAQVTSSGASSAPKTTTSAKSGAAPGKGASWAGVVGAVALGAIAL